MFEDAIETIVDDLEALALEAYYDPRAARPFSVFVQLPVFDGFTSRIADATVTLRVLAAPPLNSSTAKYLLETIDTIMAANYAVVAGRPTVAIIGDQQVPAYDLTIRVSIVRSPPSP